MTARLRAVFFALSLGLLGACAAEGFGPSIYAGMSERVDPASDPRYANPEPELRHLLLREAANRQVNHFCLLGYRWPDGHDFVSVHWLEGQMILRWSGDTTWADGSLGWELSKGVDLQTGLVDTDEQRSGSTFLETRGDAEGTLRDCQRHGRQYRIEPFEPPPEPAEDE